VLPCAKYNEAVRLRLSLVLLLLPLTSCIPVDDFGAYWARTSLDPQLKGKWKMIAASPEQTKEHGYGIGNVVEVRERDGSFELINHAAVRAEDRSIWPVRTLTTGRHHWLAVGRQKGMLLGYQIEAGYVHICPIGDPALGAFIQRRYPNSPSFDVTYGIGPPVGIKLFDAAAFAVLRDYPGADRCTEESFAKYERVP